MTRKDFQSIVKMLASLIHAGVLDIDRIKHGIFDYYVVNAIVDEHLEQTNPNYDSEKFWKAVDKEVDKLNAR